nr:hypothetical protein [Enterocloster clostridioformis]
MTVLEQITYLMFMKLLDDNQLKAEANANLLGVPQKSKVFQDLCDQREPPCGNRANRSRSGERSRKLDKQLIQFSNN